MSDKNTAGYFQRMARAYQECAAKATSDVIELCEQVRLMKRLVDAACRYIALPDDAAGVDPNGELHDPARDLYDEMTEAATEYLKSTTAAHDSADEGRA